MKRHPVGRLASAGSYRIVFVTSSRQEAPRLARGILAQKLAACVSILPGVRSWYWWKGRMASDPETLLVIKTRGDRLRSLHRWVRTHHSYEVPEFLALPAGQGDAAYLQWLSSSLRRR